MCLARCDVLLRHHRAQMCSETPRSTNGHHVARMLARSFGASTSFATGRTGQRKVFVCSSVAWQSSQYTLCSEPINSTACASLQRSFHPLAILMSNLELCHRTKHEPVPLLRRLADAHCGGFTSAMLYRMDTLRPSCNEKVERLPVAASISFSRRSGELDRSHIVVSTALSS